MSKRYYSDDVRYNRKTGNYECKWTGKELTREQRKEMIKGWGYATFNRGD